MKTFFDLQRFAEGEGDGGAAGKTFTQAELDQVIADRLTREKAKYADYADMKRAKEELDALKASQMTDQEKLKADLAAAQSKGEKAMTTANARLISAELKLAAASAGIPADRLTAALKLADGGTVTVGEDGTVTGAAEAIKACVDANPFLIANVQGVVNLPGGGQGASSEKDPEKMDMTTYAKWYADRNKK